MKFILPIAILTLFLPDYDWRKIDFKTIAAEAAHNADVHLGIAPAIVNIAQVNIVPDFTDVTDSLQMICTPRPTGLQTILKSSSTKFNTTLAGTFELYMYSTRSSNPKAIERYMQFSSRKDTVILTNGSNIVLNQVACKQSLILVKKVNLTGVPSVEVVDVAGKKVGSAMFTSTLSPNYYYAYVYGTSVKVWAQMNGTNTEKQIKTLSGRQVWVTELAAGMVDTGNVFVKLNNF